MKKIMGFTIIEVMIVIAILGILAAVALPHVTGDTRKQMINNPVVCISGYQFLADGKTQIKNESGGGVPCNAFR